MRFKSTTTNRQKYIKIALIILGLGGLVVLIYFVFFYIGKSPKICNQNFIYDDKTNSCIPMCPAGNVWNGKNCIPTCNIAGHKTNPNTGNCDIWPIDCLKNPVTVNGETGGLSGTIISDDGFSCLPPSQWNSLSNEQSILDDICKKNQCTCNDTNTCKFQECKTEQPFQGYSSSDNGCVIKRDCNVIPSDFANLFPNLNVGCKLFKHQDPNNQYNCLDLNLDDLRQKCVNDQDGCIYGYTYDKDAKLCKNAKNATMPTGESGCRDTNENREFNGTSCGNITMDYIIATDISNVTTTTIGGQLSFTKPPTKFPEIFRYLIFETNSDGSINTTGKLRFFDLTTIVNAGQCDIKASSGGCYNFLVELTGNSYDKPLSVLTKYRIIFLGYNIVNGIQTPLRIRSQTPLRCAPRDRAYALLHPERHLQ
jgi:hypothetical protein